MRGVLYSQKIETVIERLLFYIERTLCWMGLLREYTL